MGDRVTQRILGIFNGSFLYVLLCLLFLNNEKADQYCLIPVTATFLAVLSLGAFVYFINHIVNWLQVTNMMGNMKSESVNIIENSMLRELEPYRVKNTDVIKAEIPHGRGTQIQAEQSGYLQTIDFVPLIREAEKDDLVIQLEYKVGNFVFASTPLLTFWKKNGKEVDEAKYRNMFHIGKGQTEIQDIEFSINKFVEIAIRALGNDDPKTATGTLYEIGDLLIHISRVARFTPYLTDEKYHLRLILQNLDFDDYLYIGFASIRHYARGNAVLTVELLKVLNAIARAASKRDYRPVWEFVVYTVHGFEHGLLYELDRKQFYKALYDIADTTGNKAECAKLVDRISRRSGEF